jgi:hypothetical protein
MAALSDQLTRIRDGAADLLSHLGGGAATGQAPPSEGLDSIPGPPVRDAGSHGSGGASKGRVRKAASTREAAAPGPAAGRSREHVAAPGKRHRKPPASVAGAKHSNEEVAKARASDRNRRTRGR